MNRLAKEFIAELLGTTILMVGVTFFSGLYSEKPLHNLYCITLGCPPGSPGLESSFQPEFQSRKVKCQVHH